MKVEAAELTGRDTAQSHAPAAEHSCSQQQRISYGYCCRRKADTPATERKTLEPVGRYLARLAAEQNVVFGGWVVDEHGADLRARLLDRPQGKLLSGLLRAGDHVVFAGIERGRVNARNLLYLVDLWRSRGIHVYVADRASIFGDDLEVDLSDPEHARLFQEAVRLTLDL